MRGRRAGGAGRVEADGVQAPTFEVDPLWPKPLPNHWVMGMTIGLAVDERDHVWVVHRQSSVVANERALTLDPRSVCVARRPPPVLEFDPEGNLVGHWAAPVKVTNGRSRTTASRSITRATSGSAATAPRTPTFSSSPGAASFCCKSAISARTGEAMTSRTLAGRPKSRWTPRPTRFTSPTATATGA